MDHAAETIAYQQYLEGRRVLQHQHADHEDQDHINEDIDKARQAMDLAWLHHHTKG